MASKQFEHLQESSLQRLKALVPSGCPLLVRRRAPGGFCAYTYDERDQMPGRFQIVASFIQGFVTAWRRTRQPIMKACPAYTPDHNGECLLCDEWMDAHTPEAIAAGEARDR